jgi:sentrin-specific protease 1
VINFYMELLMQRGKLENYPSVYAFNTFFYLTLLSGGHDEVKSWTQKVLLL